MYKAAGKNSRMLLHGVEPSFVLKNILFVQWWLSFVLRRAY